MIKFNDFTLGRYVDLFEKKFSKYQNVKYSIGQISTDAIFLSLKALKAGKGDEVITLLTFLCNCKCYSSVRCNTNLR